MVSAYCLKEKKKQEVLNPEYGINANNHAFVKGTCKSCGSKIQGFIGADNAPADIRAKLVAKKAASAKKKGSFQKKSTGRKSGSKKMASSGKRSSKKRQSHKK